MARRFTAWGLALATVAVVALDAFGWMPSPVWHVQPWVRPFVALAVLAPACVGLLIATRQPENKVAWILLVGALTSAHVTELIPGSGWSLQAQRASWPLLYGWPIAVAYVFPNGRFLSRRWRKVARIAAVCFVGFVAEAMFDPSRFDPPDAAIPNPMRNTVVPGWIAWIWVPFLVGILCSLFAGALSVWLRLRRANGVERQQMLWLAWIASSIPLVLALGFALPVGDSQYVCLLLIETAVAIAIGIAVIRYRLYAIEQLINRTLVYATLTLFLAGTYIAITLSVGVAVGRGSNWATAAATLVVAVAFRPLRTGVQRIVDRRFDRTRYEGLQSMQAFEHAVREGERLPEEIGTVLAQVLRDPLAELFFWLPASQTFAAASGALVAELPDDGRARSEITREGTRTAVLLHEPALLEHPGLLRDVLRAAALSVEIAGLRVEVRLQLQEVQASRARIVEAGYEERRRLERDLHDGAQQRLVSLGLRLRRLQRMLPAEALILSPALDQIVEEVGSAIVDLRQIAAGVRPARLDEGLAAALRDLARSAPIPVEVVAPIGRVAAGVEAAAYFVACEALTNAVKHASASRIDLNVAQQDGALLLTISDDGVGGAVARRGSGLAGLSDRVSAHGGRLRIASPPGGGTRVEAAIPCG